MTDPQAIREQAASLSDTLREALSEDAFALIQSEAREALVRAHWRKDYTVEIGMKAERDAIIATLTNLLTPIFEAREQTQREVMNTERVTSAILRDELTAVAKRAGCAEADSNAAHTRAQSLESERDALQARVTELEGQLTTQGQRVTNLLFDLNVIGAQLEISKREDIEPAVSKIVRDRDALREMVLSLRTGSCWCGKGVDAPKYHDHSERCYEIQRLGLLTPGEPTR